MTYDARLSEFKDLIKKCEYYKYTLNSLIYWDKITYMPPDGIEYRSEVMSFLADEQYKLMTGPEFIRQVKYFSGHKQNDFTTNSMIKRISRSTKYVNKIPEEEYRSYIQLIARSEQIWEKAKKENKFEMFRPYLEDIIRTFRNFAEYWGYEKDPYDALLDYYEEGLTTETIDAITAEIKPGLIELLKTVKRNEEKNKYEDYFNIDAKSQRNIWQVVLADLGFNFDAGRVDIGSHPTILANSPKDVRIVNSYKEEDFKSGLFNAIHSGGKGIYQQSISPKLMGTLLAEVPSFTMEECIGRFYENIIGRSKGFWTYFYPKITEIAPKLKKISSEQLYESVNIVKPSLIRIEADQLTYLLHIIIRYELERELINGRLEVKNLPETWNRKYKEYLGITSETDSEGVLQDIHWAAGYVGYFPSYIVANLTAAQLKASIEKEYGNLDTLTERGDFHIINKWLSEKIYCHGAVFSGAELVKMATGQPLNSKYYMDYLQKRISEVYKLS